MSVLDDARRLAASTLPTEQYDDCWFCGVSQRGDAPAHRSDCPWLSMPKIVAVIEAAERIAKEEPVLHNGMTGENECAYCSGVQGDHAPDCPHQALVAALEG